MNKPCISHEEATIESFKKDPDYAIGMRVAVTRHWRDDITNK